MSGNVFCSANIRLVALFSRDAPMYAEISAGINKDRARQNYMLRAPSANFPLDNSGKNAPAAVQAFRGSAEQKVQTAQTSDAHAKIKTKIPPSSQPPNKKEFKEPKIPELTRKLPEDADEFRVLGGSWEAAQTILQKRKNFPKSTDAVKTVQDIPASGVSAHEGAVEKKTPPQFEIPPTRPLDEQESSPEPCPLLPDVSRVRMFEDVFPGTKWSRVHFPASEGKWHYLRGEYLQDEKVVAVALAVPGAYSARTPGWMSRSSRFYPVAGTGMGYWISWQKQNSEQGV